MTRFIPTTALTLGIALSAQMLQAAPGYTTQRLEVAHRDTALEVHLWYPTTTESTPTTIGANAVFTGTQVLQDAAPFHGSHPLIVLSHGSGGNAANLGWIAGDLAERGFNGVLWWPQPITPAPPRATPFRRRR